MNQHSFWYLLVQLVKRDVLLRYRGALVGAAWMFISPLLMLAAYVFVFGNVFPRHLSDGSDSPPFWLSLYAGLIVFNIFAETAARAPASIRGFPNYVKKIIFPIEALPLVPLGSALVHAIFGYLILTVGLAVTGHLGLGLMLFPVLLLPVLLLSLGTAWFVGAWGVFITDTSQIVPFVVQLLLFLSPVFYPSTAVPLRFRALFELNPLAVTIEACRAAVFGADIALLPWLIALAGGMSAALLGFYFFRYARDEFADAL